MRFNSATSMLIALSAGAIATALPSADRLEIRGNHCGDSCTAITYLLKCSDEWKKNYATCESAGCRIQMPNLSNQCLPCKDPKHPCVQLKDGSCGRGTVGLLHLPNISADLCKETGCLGGDDEIWKSCKTSGPA